MNKFDENLIGKLISELEILEVYKLAFGGCCCVRAKSKVTSNKVNYLE